MQTKLSLISQQNNLTQAVEKDLTFPAFLEKISLKGKLIFLLLRDSNIKIQAIIKKNSHSNENFDFFSNLKEESFLEITGILKLSKVAIKSATIQNYEIEITNIKLLSPFEKSKPFELDYAEKQILNMDLDESFSKFKILEKKNVEKISDISDQNKKSISVSKSLRLDHRVFDLRSSANHCIFKLRSFILNQMRNYILNTGAIEVQTPKILGSCSESGSEVFELNYFNKKAFLAQSPQLYKQMLIIAGFERVFEVGPVFRAEHSNTNRHLSEFVGLDFEIRLNSISENSYGFMQAVELLWAALFKTYINLKNDSLCNEMLSYLNADGLSIPEEPLVITFFRARVILRAYNNLVKRVNDIDLALNNLSKELNSADRERKESSLSELELEDLNTQEEKLLGKIIKHLYNSDLVVISNYPSDVRAFYTKRKDNIFSEGFDFILCGKEISSGAERENDKEKLKENIEKKNIEIDHSLKYYLDCFDMSTPRHAGVGVGFDRVASIFMGRDNVRDGVLFVRDMNRLSP